MQGRCQAARRNVRQTRVDTLRVRAASVETHPRRIFGPGLHRCGWPDHFASPRWRRAETHFRSRCDRLASVCVALLEMLLLWQARVQDCLNGLPARGGGSHLVLVLKLCCTLDLTRRWRLKTRHAVPCKQQGTGSLSLYLLPLASCTCT
jgi:hypothetical protein